MNTDMENILEKAARMYRSTQPGPSCFSMSDLSDYHGGDGSPEKARIMERHLASCERCRMAFLKIQTEAVEWDMLALDLATKTGERIRKLARPSLRDRVAKVVSALTEEMIEWISPPWTPEWGTAMSNEPQEREFEMGSGEYINLSCYWQGESVGSSAFIHLEWTANILSSNRLWVRFSDPENHEILYEEALGDALMGERDFDAVDLSFNPARRRWAVSIVVEAS